MRFRISMAATFGGQLVSITNSRRGGNRHTAVIAVA
jgi:hypothetical protein